MADEETATAMQTMKGDFAPTLRSLNEEVLFGQVWARTELSPRDRSLITISGLVSAGNLEKVSGRTLE